MSSGLYLRELEYEQIDGQTAGQTNRIRKHFPI